MPAAFVPLTEVVITKGAQTLACRTLAPGEYVIGRSATCDIVVDECVSDRHLALTVQHHSWLVRDLGSESGTLVNGRPIAGVTRVWPTQRVEVGPLVIELSRAKAKKASLISLSPAMEEFGEVLPGALLGERKYEIGNVVAQGGMGAILNARDTAIRRTVAMKVMLDSENQSHLSRFINEAQITGKLQHPSVVPIYELGLDAEEQVFYTMKFVEGVTLKAVLDGIKVGEPQVLASYRLANLLTVFQKVCDGIAFAHSKGIVHRDLKPENIMLGAYGEVLVMDWGLAKDLNKADGTRSPSLPAPKSPGGDITATLAGTVLGTPQFMAPEQARGEIHRIDPRTDVFALGALLYNILALQPPILGNTLEEVLAKQRGGEITPPASLHRNNEERLPHCPSGRVPSALSAVAMKALSLRPEDRYQEVPELQKEIAAFQSGFATRAEHAGLGKQTLLLIKRHKALSGAIAASIITVAALTSFYLAQVLASERRAVTAKRSADELIRYMQYDLRDALAKLGQLKMMDGINRRVRDYHEQHPPDAKNSDALRQAADALDEQGDLLQKRGDFTKALEVYRKAQDLRQRLVAHDPLNSDWQCDLAVSFRNIGGILLHQRQFGDAVAVLSTSLEMTRRLAEQEPENLLWQRHLSKCYDAIGDTVSEQGKLDEALEAYRSSVAISKRLVERDPENPERQRDLSIGYEKMGAVLQTQGKLDEALEVFRRDQEIADALARKDPENMEWQRDLSITFQRISDVLRSKGQLAEASAACHSSRRICERLVKHDPDNTEWLRDLYVTFDLTGDILQLEHRLTEALADYRRGYEITRQLAEREPSNSKWQDDMAYWLHKLAPLLERLNNPAEALACYEQALRIDENLTAVDPSQALAQERITKGRDAVKRLSVESGRAK